MIFCTVNRELFYRPSYGKYLLENHNVYSSEYIHHSINSVLCSIIGLFRLSPKLKNHEEFLKYFISPALLLDVWHSPKKPTSIREGIITLAGPILIGKSYSLLDLQNSFSKQRLNPLLNQKIEEIIEINPLLLIPIVKEMK